MASLPGSKRAAYGLVGLGLVGRALAGRLLAACHSVVGYDPAASAWEAAAGLAVKRLPSPAALSSACELMVVAVLDDSQLLAVVRSVCLQADRPTLLLSCVTCSPAAADTAAALCSAAGLAFADMPLSGSSTQIAAGTALGLLGSTADVWQRHRADLQAVSPAIFHVGKAGAGSRAKLASNLVLGLNRAALAEGLTLATALGLDAAAFLALLAQSPAASRALEVAGPRMLYSNFEPGSRIRQHRKDVGLMLDEADRLGLHLPLTQSHAGLMDRAEALGYGELDNAVLILALKAGSVSTAKEAP